MKSSRLAWVVVALAEVVTSPSSRAQPLASSVPSAVAAHPGCNVVFVSFDALQASHVGCLGNPRDVTPNLDALARQSYSFANAISVASWTVPASMTWFTGVYPSEHRMTNKFALYAPPVRKPANLKELSPELVTLADVMRRNGYDTGGFTGNAGVSGGFGYEQGFDVYYHEQNGFYGFDKSVPKALAWLAERNGRKFFLFLHGYDVHGQHVPAEGLDYRFVDPAYDKRYAGDAREQELLREEGLDKGQLDLREEDVHFWRAVYDEKVQRMDERFGRFMAEFRRLGLFDDTLFVLTSDHGTELCEHRRLDHGFTLYQEQLHVPLFIKLPRQTQGRKIAARISSIDLMPTILELTGAEVSAAVALQMRGKSLFPAMRGEPSLRDNFAETDYRAYTYKRAIVAPDGWKLIYTLESRTCELFDLATDPRELKDLSELHPNRADELQRKLFSHFKTIGHDLTARRWERGLNPVYASQAKE